MVALRELTAEKERQQQAKLATKEHDILQQQARKVEAKKQRLQRLQKAAEKRATAALKEANLQAEKDDKAARNQLQFSLQLSAKRPAFKVVKSPIRKKGSSSKNTAKLAEEPDLRPTTRTRAVRQPERYRN